MSAVVRWWLRLRGLRICGEGAMEELEEFWGRTVSGLGFRVSVLGLRV